MTMLMCNSAWMRHYQGITDTDYPINGGAFIDGNGYGHEVINFQKNGRFVYGYVQAKNGTINIDRIGGQDQDYVDDVLVVWRARSTIGSVVIGWYRNARVYRHEQEGNGNCHFEYKNIIYHPGYLIRARAENAFLVPAQHRFFHIPVTHPGFGAQTFVSFLDNEKINEVTEFRLLLEGYIENVEDGNYAAPVRGRRGQIDAETKARIEVSAIDTAVEFYLNRGYNVESVESDNVGYDLLASRGREVLYVEVKGTLSTIKTRLV